MPDGTSLNGAYSNLFSTMNSKFSQAAWQNAIARAAASWSAIAGINLVQVSDNGTTLGSGQYQQGDPGMGDIRIGSYSQGPSTLAWAFRPPNANGGSAAGDIFFNSNIAWQINNGNYDLQTVAMHEFGHALGLDHSSLNTAEMWPYYGGLDQTLETDDIDGMQAVWGPRQPDWTTQFGPNSTMSTAYDTSPNLATSVNQVIMWNLNITGPMDFHWYKVVTPSNASSTFTATIQTTGLSLLQPRVQIYNATGQGLVQTYGTFSPTGSQTTATIYNATPNTTYYVRTGPGASGPASAGAYALIVNMGSQPTYFIQPPNTTVARKPDQGGGSSGMSTDPERIGGRVPGLIQNPTADEDTGMIRIGSYVGWGDELRVKPRTNHPKSHRVIGFQHPRGVARQFAARLRNPGRHSARPTGPQQA